MFNNSRIESSKLVNEIIEGRSDEKDVIEFFSDY